MCPRAPGSDRHGWAWRSLPLALLGVALAVMGAETIGPVPAAAAALSLTGLVVALYLLMTQPHGRVDQSVIIEAAVSGGGPAARVATAPDGRLLRANEAFERDFSGDAPSVLDRLEAQGADRSALRLVHAGGIGLAGYGHRHAGWRWEATVGHHRCEPFVGRRRSIGLVDQRGGWGGGGTPHHL